MFKDDLLANVLYIDLSQKKYWVERREDLLKNIWVEQEWLFSFLWKNVLPVVTP